MLLWWRGFDPLCLDCADLLGKGESEEEIQGSSAPRFPCILVA